MQRVVKQVADPLRYRLPLQPGGFDQSSPLARIHANGNCLIHEHIVTQKIGDRRRIAMLLFLMICILKAIRRLSPIF